MTHDCFVIAEAGVNHNGDITLAKRLIEAAAWAGADAVKFQTFFADKLVTLDASKAHYQANLTGDQESQFSMLKELELTFDDFLILKDFADQHDIEFMSTAFDADSLDFLVEEVGVRRLKVPSGEITNGPLLLKYAQKRLPLILSTGMSTVSEIRDALKVIAFGLAGRNELPTEELLEIEFGSNEGWRDNVTLLHCTSEYPAPLSEINLRAMDHMSDLFEVPCGYSDHSEGVHVSLAAAALGAVVIEKHFTVDKTLRGPDHQASLEPIELRDLVAGVRNISLALGKKEKKVGRAEEKNIAIVRRGLYASADISESDVFTSQNVTCLRPTAARSPMQYWETIGQRATKRYRRGDPIE